MKTCVFSVTVAVALSIPATAALPDRTPENVAKYAKICRDFVTADMKGMYREPEGAVTRPYLVPGASYAKSLWDWDSWLAGLALEQILVDCGTPDDRAVAYGYMRGCVLNFLEYASAGGWIPINLHPSSPSCAVATKDGTYLKRNMHKPCLAQQAAFIVRHQGGDAEWLRDLFPKLQKFVNRYLNHYRHRETGLLFWANDTAIGVDNDPSTFYRPPKSSGSIYLNALMYRELLAMAYLCERLGQREIGNFYEREAATLKAAVRRHCWDPRDGFYYSVDLNLEPREDVSTGRHSGQPRTYDCLIQRIDCWSGFLALWSGVASKEEAEEIVARNYRDVRRFNAPAGVRTLSPLEKMYDLRASGNPSSWLGPVWGISNWMTFRGLVRYGYRDDARELAEKTVILFGYDIERFGALHEYYLPESGEPVMNKGFQNWNYLVLNMVDWLEGNPDVVEF